MAVLLLSVLFLRERTGAVNVAGILLSVAGAALIVLQRGDGAPGGSDDLLGVAIAVVSMSSYAGYLV